VKAARATAHSNIALVKYWGKREGVDPDLNLPAVGSLSMTLDELRTETTVRPAARDSFVLDGVPQENDSARKVFAHLDRVHAATRALSPRPPCHVDSTNHLPTAAGLASSAAGFAALTLAAATAFAVTDTADLPALARRGSGSAMRSLWGGFVRLDAGTRADGSDCVARRLFGPDHVDVRLLVVHTAAGPKPVGSTGGMERCRETSPYYMAWVAQHLPELDAAHAALTARDLPALGAVMERSCFRMHASMFAMDPPLVYWNGATLDAIREVWAARAQGLAGWVTSDAGPHVKVLCATSDAPALAERLRGVRGVLAVQAVAPGPDASARVLAEDER
jgi:diphosphomevalonate decarboxylase